MARRERRSTRALALAALGLTVALAAVLRLVELGAVRLDPFYDAAVRSMGISWHNFLFGAYEPGGSVSIDKPPVDLWLQVASVKLLGWGGTSLKLPQALAGTAAVALLYGALRRTFGSLAALLAALALAVMPIEVITARSDTMDAVMMALLVVALLALMRAAERSPDNGRLGLAWLVVSAGALGLAFNVKLLESLVALPGLLTTLWLARASLGVCTRSGVTRRAAAERAVTWRVATARALALGAVYVLVSLSWLLATLAFPARERPWAIGSTDGSPWNAAFVFNGSERITGKAMEVGQRAVAIAPPSPARLLARSGQLPARWLGWLALAALILAVPALLSAWRRRAERPLAWAATAGLSVWLLTGLVLFSEMARLHPRYVEAFTPAVAAMLGLGIAWLLSLSGARKLLALAPLGLLALSAAVSVQVVKGRVSDAGNVGAMRPAEQRALSAYLRAHSQGARYELAAASATSVASLIVADVRPVLMLTTYNGLPFTSVQRLKLLVARGEVRYALLDSGCSRHGSPRGAGCSRAARWVRSHAQDVSREAGLGRRGLLWRLPGAIA
jgi:4-amino-4-deoxy-L-arabinose transferase-like glycosyltransferase